MSLRDKSPSERFLLDASFCRWEKQLFVFTFPALDGFYYTAVCDLLSPAGSTFVLSLRHEDHVIAPVTDSARTRINAKMAALLSAVTRLEKMRRDADPEDYLRRFCI